MWFGSYQKYLPPLFVIYDDFKSNLKEVKKFADVSYIENSKSLLLVVVVTNLYALDDRFRCKFIKVQTHFTSLWKHPERK